jgi:hypothetical protein
MSIPPLLSIASKTLVPLARDIVEQVTSGLSFQKRLRLDRPSRPDANKESADHPRFPSAANATATNAAQLEAIRSQPLKELEAYVERLRERLLVAGIDLSTEIPLKVGLGGDIQVDGAHPDRAAIEDLFANDSQLSATFRMLSNALTDRYDVVHDEPFSSELQLTIDASEFTVAML